MSNSGDTADGLVERTGGTPVPPGTPPKVIPDLPPAKWPPPLRCEDLRDFLKEHQPGSISIGSESEVRGPIPPERDRDRARHEDCEHHEHPDITRCMKRIQDLERIVAGLQSQIVNLRLAVKGLQKP